MVILSDRFIVLVFVVIYILISFVRGNLEEIDTCQSQIKAAFGKCQYGFECLRFAVKYYVKDENTASSSQSASGSQSVPDSYLNDQSFGGQFSGQDGTFQLPIDPYSNNQPFGQVQAGQNIYYQPFDQVQADPYSNNQPFGQVQAGQNIYYQPFDQVQADIELYADNFYGLKDFIEKDLKKQQNPDEPPSGPNVTTEQVLNYAKQLHKTLETVGDGREYATLYHNELEAMINGKGVPRKSDYCQKFVINSYDDKKPCMDALNEFGNTSKSAVIWAFQRYTLAECEFLKKYFPKYEYIADYMNVISSRCNLTYTTNPLKFCEDTVQKLFNL